MDKDENTQKKLISLLKLFKNRPYHLSKYLFDNNALTKDFLNKISKSDRLSDISDNQLPQFFQNLNQMEDFYNSLLEEKIQSTLKKNKQQLSLELNDRLNKLIVEEKYEEAAALRDFMLKNGIKKK